MADVRVKLNRRGVRDLLQSEEVADELKRRADAIAAAAGPGHRVEVEVGAPRSRAAVITDDTDAALAEARDRNLTRAVDAGR